MGISRQVERLQLKGVYCIKTRSIVVVEIAQYCWISSILTTFTNTINLFIHHTYTILMKSAGILKKSH